MRSGDFQETTRDNPRQPEMTEIDRNQCVPICEHRTGSSELDPKSSPFSQILKTSTTFLIRPGGLGDPWGSVAPEWTHPHQHTY